MAEKLDPQQVKPPAGGEGSEAGVVEEGKGENIIKRGKQYYIAYYKPDGKQKWEESQYHGVIVVVV